MTDLAEAMARCSSEQLTAIATNSKGELSFARATDGGVDSERVAPRATERNPGFDELHHALLHTTVQELARRNRAAIDLREAMLYSPPLGPIDEPPTDG